MLLMEYKKKKNARPSCKSDPLGTVQEIESWRY